jgi:FkbM family methyltransferase
VRGLIDNPRFTYDLVKRRAFDDNAFLLIDVGMMGGIEPYWHSLGDQIEAIGFEPDQAECDRINATPTIFRKRCFPVALDSAPQRRVIRRRAYNLASSGYYVQRYWWTNRFGLGPMDRTPFDYSLPPRESTEEQDANADIEIIETTTLVRFLAEIGVSDVDFLKVDVEGADFDVLLGAEKLLSPQGFLGVKCEVRLIPDRDIPLFHEIYAYLFSRGYFLMQMDLNRASRRVLPMPVAWEHKNHLGEPIAGPTERGQITDGDILMCRDLMADGFEPRSTKDAQRILKAAAMFEIFDLPDCAAELLLYYRPALDKIVPVADLIEQLVPLGYNPQPDFAQYVREQHRTVQRLRPNRGMRST